MAGKEENSYCYEVSDDERDCLHPTEDECPVVELKLRSSAYINRTNEGPTENDCLLKRSCSCPNVNVSVATVLEVDFFKTMGSRLAG